MKMEQFESVDEVVARLRKVDYLSDANIAGVVYLADRLQKPSTARAATEHPARRCRSMLTPPSPSPNRGGRGRRGTRSSPVA